MNKIDFEAFYDKTIKILAKKFVQDNPGFTFFDNLSGLYEEYMNQKAMLHWVYGKEEKLLDRHKTCACVAVAVIKTKLLSSGLSVDDKYALGNAHCANEQLAFLASWELLKAFITMREEKNVDSFTLPDTFHNLTFEETVTRSLFMANQLNGLSTPLIANMFFLLEKYCTDTQK